MPFGFMPFGQRPRALVPLGFEPGRIVHPRFRLDSPFLQPIRGIAAVRFDN